MEQAQTTPAVTLENCDREPIHIPGLIQPHGALLAFDSTRRLIYLSDNAAALLGNVPALGVPLDAAHFGGHAAIHATLAEGFDLPGDDEVHPHANEVTLGYDAFDLIVHRSGNAVVCEFEKRPDEADRLADFALKAHRGMDRLRRQRTVQALLDMAVAELAALTGFDRVTAYRFRHDDSGDVVAERRREDLDPFLNRRYPASDIPAQARRLYTVNTLRLIADIKAVPVPVRGLAAAPLDMSHCVLRSVSPVHIEYLTNMGVGASMSVSIVINGQLWGMLACHHMGPRRVPYSVRMACDVLAQILASNLQSVIARAEGEHISAAAGVRARVVERMLHLDESLAALTPLAPDLCATFDAGAVVLSEDERIWVHGDVDATAARGLVRWLDSEAEGKDGLLARRNREGMPEALAASLGAWCGLLALRYDAFAGAWLVLLRKEEVETIHWGGTPEKQYTSGPLGPRLTPRGSFDVWRETVRGAAVPWSLTDLGIARQLFDELMRSTSLRHAEISRSRTQLMAMLGHDLRDPLQSISLAASVLQMGGDKANLGQRIQNSSTRMQRLISQVLDMSRLQAGMGLGFHFQQTDLKRLVEEIVEEASESHPGSQFSKNLPPSLMAEVDGDRIAQLLGNLIGNARHHGTPGEPILVQLSERGGMVELEVSNHGPEIPAETMAQLFNPFKRRAHNPRNRSSLGLGLYIAHEVVAGHGGTLQYAFADPYVVFTASFPVRQADAAS